MKIVIINDSISLNMTILLEISLWNDNNVINKKYLHLHLIPSFLTYFSEHGLIQNKTNSLAKT